MEFLLERNSKQILTYNGQNKYLLFHRFLSPSNMNLRISLFLYFISICKTPWETEWRKTENKLLRNAQPAFSIQSSNAHIICWGFFFFFNACWSDENWRIVKHQKQKTKKKTEGKNIWKMIKMISDEKWNFKWSRDLCANYRLS